MSNIYHFRLKVYPNGLSEYVQFKKGITIIDSQNNKINTKENKKTQLTFADIPHLPTRVDDLTEFQKLARRKTKVRDYTLSGNFYYFGTMTFRHEDAHKALDDVFRHKMILFTRMLRRRGIRYYIVAEKHSGGGLNHGMIHLHGLFSENLPVMPSPASKRYLNIPLWGHGFSSVAKIRDQTGTANYITKYVTKEALDGKSVWVSQGLMRPQVSYNVPDLLTPIVSEWENDNVIKIIRSR